MDRLYTHTTDIHNTSAAKEILPVLKEMLHFNSVVDIGCGLGTWLSVARDLGSDPVIGIDGDYLDSTLLTIPKDLLVYKDLREPFELDRKFDLAISLEVAEHLPTERAKGFVSSLAKLSETILFSAAIPGQGGQNHLNEQWPKYWANLFAEYGYMCYDVLRARFWNNPGVEWWYTQNILLFSRKEIPEWKSEKPIPDYVSRELYEKKLHKLDSLAYIIQSQKDINSQLLAGKTGINQALRILFKAVKNKLFTR